jgi:predicted N-acetyltransferase YhbS
MEVNIRPETENDYFEVEKLTRETFWNLYVPGCDEHYLCHIIRSHQDYISDLDYIAEIDGTIVGSIMYTKSWLIDENDEKTEVVSFGPLCVHPKYQRRGIGTKLIEKTKAIIKQKGIPAIVIYGDPHNYCKHGFKNGIDYNVSNMDGEFPLGLLVLELEKGFFGNKNWKIKQSDVFTFDQNAVTEFDKKFEEKEKLEKYSQELFKMQIRAYLRNFS